MRLKVSRLKEMIHDEIVHMVLGEQRSSVDTGEYLGNLGATATPGSDGSDDDPGTSDPAAVGGEQIASEEGQEDQAEAAAEDSAPDPTSPERQAQHIAFQQEKEGEEASRTADARAAKEV